MMSQNQHNTLQWKWTVNARPTLLAMSAVRILELPSLTTTLDPELREKSTRPKTKNKNQHNTQVHCMLFCSSQYPQLNGREQPSSAYQKMLIFKLLKSLCQAQRPLLVGAKNQQWYMDRGKKEHDLNSESTNMMHGTNSMSTTQLTR